MTILDIVKLMLKLSIFFIWFISLSLKIIQHYNCLKKKKLSINFFDKNTTIILRKWSNLVDKQKQVNFIFFNIIHSLDTSHLISILCFYKDLKFSTVIKIYNCFGILSNKLDKLLFIIKMKFIL